MRAKNNSPTQVMNYAAETKSSLPDKDVALLHKPVWILFLVLYAAVLVCSILRISIPPMELLLLLCSSGSLLIGMARRLPIQNVIGAGFLVSALAITILSVGSITGVPFVPIRFTLNGGLDLFGSVPLFIPFLWITVILSSRGVARLIARPWRKGGSYGFWVIGLTVLLCLVFDLALEPYASFARKFWVWKISSRVWNWYGTPWSNFLGWGITALGILIVGTPWFINKQPIKQPTDYHPLTIWMMLTIYLAVQHALDQRWLALFVPVPFQLAAVCFAVKGGRW
jgi:uncharacterized membrane protein